MADPRVEQYARLLVERCLGVQPGWQVVVSSTPLARPLVEEVVRQLAQIGSYPLVRLSFRRTEVVDDVLWAEEAPDEVLSTLPASDLHMWQTADAAMTILAPENTRDGNDLPPERQALMSKAFDPVRPRFFSEEIKWVGCVYPTAAMAQDADLSLPAFEDFIYGACLIDWDAEGMRMARIAERFDRAAEVRIVGTDTDLTLSLEGRHGKIDAGGGNMPGGEVFYSPVEDSAEGVVTFSEYPASRSGINIEGVRLRFEGGRAVEASAHNNEDFLLKTLDTDEGARVLGELGIGCNPGIQRSMGHPLFDEKIDGTVHLALGHGFPSLGGTNVSAVHWDMVKDMRGGGELYCDGELVQQGGRWLI